MKYLHLPRKRVPDDEYIAVLRRSIALWDRWRYWLILIHVAMLVAAIWLLTTAIPLIIGLVQPANAPIAMMGFIFGIVLGLSLGGILQHIFHGLVLSLGGFRSERLLVKHHDALNSLLSRGDRPPEPDTEIADCRKRIDVW